MPSHRFQWNFASLKGLPQNSKRQTGFCFGFFRGEIDHPPVFLGFHQGNRFKIGKMYEALTAMVFNQLLWGFAHIFLHPWFMSAASISQFDWRLVNQQRQIYDSVFRLFDSSKYLTTLRPNISRWQKATTLILITLYNPLFRLWKSSKNLWAPPVTQFLLLAVTWPNKPIFFSSSYKMIDQERWKMWKTFEFFGRNGKIYV